MIRRFAAAYFGGALGAVVVTLVLWGAARTGLLKEIDVAWRTSLSWEHSIAPNLLLGSLWGLGLPLLRSRIPNLVRACLLLSMAPAMAQLFYWMPRAGHGMLGVELGALTPVVILVASLLWGYTLSQGVARVESSA